MTDKLYRVCYRGDAHGGFIPMSDNGGGRNDELFTDRLKAIEACIEEGEDDWMTHAVEMGYMVGDQTDTYFEGQKYEVFVDSTGIWLAPPLFHTGEGFWHNDKNYEVRDVVFDDINYCWQYTDTYHDGGHYYDEDKMIKESDVTK